jgi:hypothetical protein
VNTNADTANDKVMIRGLSFLVEVADFPSITGRIGRTQGLAIVSIPNRKANKDSCMSPFYQK